MATSVDPSGDMTSAANQRAASTGLMGDAPSVIVAKPMVRILVLSDVTCPWCWVGKKVLENAMKYLEEKFNFEVDYAPFLLLPNCPKEGLPNPSYNTPDVRVQHVRQAGLDNGIEITSLCPIVPNSVPALMLREFVRTRGFPNNVVGEVTEKLHEAYFTKGLALTQEDLLKLAASLGLDVDAVEDYLEDPENERKIIEQAASYREQGVQAAPFFFMNGKAVCSGAQKPGDFVKTILKVAERFPGEAMGDEAYP